MKRPAYSRLDEEVYDEVKRYSVSSGRTISAAMEELVSQGLIRAREGDVREALEKNLAKGTGQLQKLEQERADLVARLQICEKNESLARTARQQAELVKNQLEEMLSLGVAQCGTQGCQQVWRLYDVWRHQCPLCGGMAARLLEHYTPVPTTGEAVRDVLAVVGGATALVGLLNAMSGGTEIA